MAVKIRLSRIGKKFVPFYRVVAIDSRKKRDGAALENLGTYDAHAGSFVQFHGDRINDWISKGAIVTDSVKKLIKRHKKVAKQDASPVKASKKVSTAKKKIEKEESKASA